MTCVLLIIYACDIVCTLSHVCSDIDVLLGVAGKLMWYESMSAATSFMVHAIGSVDGLSDSLLVDVDGDGDADIVATSSLSKRAIIYRNGINGVHPSCRSIDLQLS